MAACGHINKHSKNMAGELDNLACEKDAGHDGNHGAHHLQRLPADGGKILLVGGKEEKVWTEWNDAAGTLASEIKPQIIAKTDDERAREGFLKNLVGGDIPEGTRFG